MVGLTHFVCDVSNSLMKSSESDLKHCTKFINHTGSPLFCESHSTAGLRRSRFRKCLSCEENVTDHKNYGNPSYKHYGQWFMDYKNQNYNKI